MQGLLYFVKKAFYCWLAATSISIWNDASSKDSINRSYLSYSYTWYQIKKVFPKNVQWLIVNLLQSLSQLIFPILSVTKFQITLELNAIVKKSFDSKVFLQFKCLFCLYDFWVDSKYINDSTSLCWAQFLVPWMSAAKQ